MSQSAPLLSTLENYVALASTRQRAISTNMANVDTPGYHAKDIDFQGELNRAIHSASSLTTNGEPVHLTPAVRDVEGLMERADGNNVDLDRESLLMSETQLQYQMGIQLIKNHFHELLSVINGGN